MNTEPNSAQRETESSEKEKEKLQRELAAEKTDIYAWPPTSITSGNEPRRRWSGVRQHKKTLRIIGLSVSRSVSSCSLGEKSMLKINIKDIAEESWTSPKGKFGGASKEISVALGRKPLSRDLNERHPFDIEICRIPPGKSHCPYHSHSAQWEFYHVISGKGIVRHSDGTTSIEAGDAFIFGARGSSPA